MRASVIFFIAIVTTSVAFTQDIPYRNDSTYKLELKMEFKVPESQGVNTVEPGRERKIYTDPELYVNIRLNLLQLLDNDYKIKVTNNKGQLLLSKKLKKPDDYLIKIGNAKDAKSRKSAHQFTIQFLNGDKQVESLITIEIKEDGDFLVNDKLFGKI